MNTFIKSLILRKMSINIIPSYCTIPELLKVYTEKNSVYINTIFIRRKRNE